VGEAMVAGAAQLESDAFEGGYIGDKGGPFQNQAAFKGGLLLGGGGLTAMTLAGAVAKEAVEAFDKASATTATTMLKMGTGGATLTVDSLIGPTSQIKMVQGDLPGGVATPATSSQFVMSDAGSKVSLTNMALAELSMTGGSDCKLTIGGGTTGLLLNDAQGATLESATEVMVGVKDGTFTSSAYFTAGGVTMQQKGGYKVELTEATGSLTDATGVNGLKLSESTASLGMGALGIDVTAEDIKFFGAMVSISASGMMKIL